MDNLTDTSLITNHPSIEETEEFGRHVLDHQYSLHWRSWRGWQTRSWSPIFPPLNKLKNLTYTFLITNNPSVEEAEGFDRYVLDHQYSNHWRSWRVWQTRSSSPILPPLRKLRSLKDTLSITNTSSIEGANEFVRHVLDHQYTLHLWSWKVWQTRSSPILPSLKKLKSLPNTFLITNTPSNIEAEEFDRLVLDHKYSLH